MNETLKTVLFILVAFIILAFARPTQDEPVAPEDSPCPWPEAEECPPGRPCLDVPGAFFKPTPAQPVHRVNWQAPAGTYTRVRLRFDVVFGGWSEPVSGRHNFFWLVVGGNRDMLGYLNGLGPRSWQRPDVGRLQLSHGVGIRQREEPKLRVTSSWRPVVGEVYGIDYLYDTADGVVRLTISHDGDVVATLEDVPNVASFTVDQKTPLLIDFGFPGDKKREPWSLGWEFQNLRAELFSA